MAGQANLPEVKPGQIWRLSSGDEVIVQGVQGEHISGASRMAARSGSGELRGTEALAAFEGHLRQFEGAALISPVFRVTFLAPVQGKHPDEDPVFQALTSAPGVQVDNRRTPHIASGTPQGKIQANLAEYVAEVAAPDAETAKSIVSEAVKAHGAISKFSADEIR